MEITKGIKGRAGSGAQAQPDLRQSEQHVMEDITEIFHRLETLSYPEEWIEQRKKETLLESHLVLMDQANDVSYGKTVEGGPESLQKKKDEAEFFRGMFYSILKSLPQASNSNSSRGAMRRRVIRSRQMRRGGRTLANYEHERHHVPVLSKKSKKTATDYPSVSKRPALDIDVLWGVTKSIEDFVERFPGVNIDGHDWIFNFAFKAMFYPGPLLLESSKSYKDFRKLARNIFVNTKTKTTLVFLGGAEPYRQADMLFSAAVSAIPGLAKKVGMAECIAFYPDLMCAEYDFIGLGLKELLQGNHYSIMKKIECIKGLDRDDEGDVFQYKEELINRMPFVVTEICNVAQRLINNGLVITKATPNNFAVDITDNTRPMLAILDCLSPLGFDFKTPGRQVKKKQHDAQAPNRIWFEEVEEERTIEEEEEDNDEDVIFSEEKAAGTEENDHDNIIFSQDKSETLYRVPAYMKFSCAPEIANVSSFNGVSDVSEVTEASTAYVIGKVLKEILNVAKNNSDSVVIDSLLMSKEIMNTINIMCCGTPLMRCPVSFLSTAVVNLINNNS